MGKIFKKTNSMNALRQVQSFRLPELARAERVIGTVEVNGPNKTFRQRTRPGKAWATACEVAAKKPHKAERKHETLPGNLEAIEWARRNCTPQHDAHVHARRV